MKTTLTRKQSARLFDLGVPNEKASEVLVDLDKEPIEDYAVFTIPDLISLVPRFLRGELAMVRDGKYWKVGSIYPDGTLKVIGRRKELLDALYDSVLYLLKIDKETEYIR